MNFKYWFENTPELGLRMKILPNKAIKGDIFMIEAWLSGDVQGNGNYELVEFNKFIENSEKHEEQFWGNSMIVDLKKGGDSTIRWCFEDEMPSNNCTLPTQMLYEILQIWVAKQNELRGNEE